ncbi:hypothetical protein E4G67_04730, partial [Candidatus Bathyarchaeota archaeon]
MSEVDMKDLITKYLDEKLTGDKSPMPELTPEPAPVAPEKPIVKHLDPDDTVRLENFILKQHNETLIRQLEDVRRKDFEKSMKQTRDDYQDYLVEKYKVDTSTHKIEVDATS